MEKKIIALLIMIGLMFSCNNDNNSEELQQNQICDSTNTVFNQIYDNLVSDINNIEENSLDLVTHGFTFELTSNANLCQIGYRSQPTFEMFDYVIEIYDNTNGVLAYTGNHTFSSTNTEYVSIGSLSLTAGNSYTVKRIQNNFTNDITILIGRLVRKQNGNNLNFPLILNNLKITSSIYGNPSLESIGYETIPYIDLVFE